MSHRSPWHGFAFSSAYLWGELVPETQSSRAARWYRKAIEYLPCYVKARVHLAEIYLQFGRTGDAEALLIPAVSSGDPEVNWRLADVMKRGEDSRMRKRRCRPRDPASRLFWKTPARVCRPWCGVLFRQWQRCREGRLNWRASTSRIVQHFGLSSRPMRPLWASAKRMSHPKFSLPPRSAGEERRPSSYRRW